MMKTTTSFAVLITALLVGSVAAQFSVEVVKLCILICPDAFPIKIGYVNGKFPAMQGCAIYSNRYDGWLDQAGNVMTNSIPCGYVPLRPQNGMDVIYRSNETTAPDQLTRHEIYYSEDMIPETSDLLYMGGLIVATRRHYMTQVFDYVDCFDGEGNLKSNMVFMGFYHKTRGQNPEVGFAISETPPPTVIGSPTFLGGLDKPLIGTKCIYKDIPKGAVVATVPIVTTDDSVLGNYFFDNREGNGSLVVQLSDVATVTLSDTRTIRTISSSTRLSSLKTSWSDTDFAKVSLEFEMPFIPIQTGLEYSHEWTNTEEKENSQSTTVSLEEEGTASVTTSRETAISGTITVNKGCITRAKVIGEEVKIRNNMTLTIDGESSSSMVLEYERVTFGIKGITVYLSKCGAAAKLEVL